MLVKATGQLFIPLFIHPQTYLSINPPSFFHPPHYPSIYLYIFPSFPSSICLLPTYPLIYISTHLSIYLSIHLSFHPSIYPSINPSFHLSIHPSVHLCICPSFLPSFHLSICPLPYSFIIHLSIHPINNLKFLLCASPYTKW